MRNTSAERARCSGIATVLRACCSVGYPLYNPCTSLIYPLYMACICGTFPRCFRCSLTQHSLTAARTALTLPRKTQPCHPHLRHRMHWEQTDRLDNWLSGSISRTVALALLGSAVLSAPLAVASEQLLLKLRPVP